MRDVTVELKGLRLHGMAGAWVDLVEQGGNNALDTSRWLVEHLLQADNTGRVQQLRLSDEAAKRNLTVNYTDFQPLDAQPPLPFARALFVQAQQPSAGAVTAAINYNKVEVSRSRLSFPFEVPKGYRRLR